MGAVGREQEARQLKVQYRQLQEITEKLEEGFEALSIKDF
jgi:hypothetical protein